jgi:hypothetical protein
MSLEPAAITITFTPAPSSGPRTLVSNAEIIFNIGPLAGLKLCGFALWRGKTHGLSVAPPTTTFERDGQTMRYKLLRPVDEARPASMESLCRKILSAYNERNR